jgi:hypothetical protein
MEGGMGKDAVSLDILRIQKEPSIPADNRGKQKDSHF